MTRMSASGKSSCVPSFMFTIMSDSVYLTLSSSDKTTVHSPSRLWMASVGRSSARQVPDIRMPNAVE